jgi:hypothetical protein
LRMTRNLNKTPALLQAILNNKGLLQGCDALSKGARRGCSPAAAHL